MLNYSRILVLSPHVDDGELGCGGSIVRWIEEGKDIHYVVFSTCEKSVPDSLPKDILATECQSSLKVLGIPISNVTILGFDVRTFPEVRQKILDKMIRLKQEIEPALVLTTSSKDTHQDHSTIFWETVRAFKKHTTIWGYQHPWNNLASHFNVFVKLEQKHLETKIEALGCYGSQADRSYFDQRFIRAQSYTHGMHVDCPNAEVFELIRLQV